MRDPGACPAGEPHLSWAKFATAGVRRLAADPDAVTRRVAAVRPDDTVTVLYTSGTTGKPKGVRLTHRNVLYETAALKMRRAVIHASFAGVIDELYGAPDAGGR